MEDIIKGDEVDEVGGVLRVDRRDIVDDLRRHVLRRRVVPSTFEDVEDSLGVWRFHANDVTRPGACFVGTPQPCESKLFAS